MLAAEPEEIPTSSGVYQIRCRRNGKIYVGSAINLSERWRAHRRDLSAGGHVNPHLQSAWSLYGEASFEFSVFEHVGPSHLLIAEQRWIERTRCTNREIGFNIKPEATSAGLGTGRVWPGFRDPTGNPVTIVNLSDFCRRNHLTLVAMAQLFKGRSKLKSHKGWTHVNSVRQRDKTHMVAVASGRITSHRGWTHVRGKKKQPPAVHKGFLAPGGAVVRITNLSPFCRVCGLSLVHMFQLKSGKRSSHKGWTWKQSADQAFDQ